jgi:hypothetical protein
MDIYITYIFFSKKTWAEIAAGDLVKFLVLPAYFLLELHRLDTHIMTLHVDVKDEPSRRRQEM